MKKEQDNKYTLVSEDDLRSSNLSCALKTKKSRSDDAHYMDLGSKSNSKESEALNRDSVSLIWAYTGRKKKPGKKLEACVGALMADLMEAAASGRDGWGYREYSSGSFTNCPVGYTVFRRAVEALVALGYVEHVPGTRYQKLSGAWVGYTSRFRATDKLLALAADAGVTRATRAIHYGVDPKAVAKRPALILKSEKDKHRRIKSGGGPVRVDLSHPLAAEHAKRVEEINAAIDCHTIELPAQPGFPRMRRFKGFHRIFSRGGKPSYQYDQGGRLYAIGSSYQGIEREFRPYLLVDGEQSAEIDIGSSQFRILFALLGKPIDAAIDPYDLPRIPREVAKLWFAQTIGHHKLHRGWTPDNRKEYAAGIRPGRDLSEDYPIRVVEAAALKRWPFLMDWETCPFKWGTLQYEEAQIVIGAVHTLVTKHGVPAYPVHDSIIVPATDQELAIKVLGESFRARFGVLPKITVK